MEAKVENDKKQTTSKGTRVFREAIRKRLDDEAKTLLLNLIEIHEDQNGNEYYVNIRDVIPDRTNVCFPMSMCKKVVDTMLDSKLTTTTVNDNNEENKEQEVTEKSKINEFNVTLIKDVKIESDDKKYFLEFAKTSNDEKILRGGIIKESTNDENEYPWLKQGHVILRNVFIGKIIKTLVDIMVRYQSIKNLPNAPSFYSASGGRRFFFDINETKWGKRLQISQLTTNRRNTIGVPLENLVQFRDRLDYFIKELTLDDTSNMPISQPILKTSKIRRIKKSRRGPPRPRKIKSGDVVRKNPKKVANVESNPNALPATEIKAQ